MLPAACADHNCYLILFWCCCCCCCQVPFYWPATNHLHCGLWLVLAYISTLAVAVTHLPADMTALLTMVWRWRCACPACLSARPGCTPPASTLLNASHSHKRTPRIARLLQYVLYGTLPAFLAGAGLSAARQRLIARDLAAIEAAPVGSRPRDVLRLQVRACAGSGRMHAQLLAHLQLHACKGHAR